MSRGDLARAQLEIGDRDPAAHAARRAREQAAAGERAGVDVELDRVLVDLRRSRPRATDSAWSRPRTSSRSWPGVRMIVATGTPRARSCERRLDDDAIAPRTAAAIVAALDDDLEDPGHAHFVACYLGPVRCGSLIVSIVLAACGRLGFDDQHAAPDAAPFAPTSNACTHAASGPFEVAATFPSSGAGYGVWSAAPYLLEADTTGGLHALRFDGTTFTETGTLSSLGWVEAVVGDGAHFYVGAPGTGFYVVDLASDGTLQVAAQDLTITEARHAWFGDGLLYVPSGPAGAFALRYDGVSLSHVGAPTATMSFSQGVWADSSRVFLADGNVFRVLSFDGSTFSDVVPPNSDHPSTSRIWSYGSLVLVAAGDGLIAQHFANNTLTELATFPTASPARDVWSDGQHVFVAAEEDGLYALAFDGSQFTVLDHLPTVVQTLGVFGDGTYLYVNDYGGLTAYRGFACDAW